MTDYTYEYCDYLSGDIVVEAQQVALKVLTYHAKLEKVKKGQTKRHRRSKVKRTKRVTLAA